MSDHIKKHFVTFYSPGTFVSESDTKPIDDWEVDAAIAMARDITQRYSATPYGFQFSTRERGPDDLDSKETCRSSMYYLGGKIETLAEIKDRNDSSERVLLSNMEGNGWDKIIVNTNSWLFRGPFIAGDVLLDVNMKADK